MSRGNPRPATGEGQGFDGRSQPVPLRPHPGYLTIEARLEAITEQLHELREMVARLSPRAEGSPPKRVAVEGFAAEGVASIAEAMAFLGLGNTEIYSLMKRGELKYCKFGRRRMIPRKALLAYVAKNTIGGE